MPRHFTLRSRQPSEWDEQAALFDWAAHVAAAKWPELYLLHASLNGAHLVGGAAQAAKLKRSGQKNGVPDICLPVPRGDYHGLWIELKRAAGGTASDDQLWWGRCLQRLGYRFVLARGFEAAQSAIFEYMTLEKPYQQFTISPPPALTKQPTKPRANRRTSPRQQEIRL